MPNKKTPKAAESRAQYGEPKNRKRAPSSVKPFPIRLVESEMLGERIRGLMGDESQRGFAAKCHVSDTAMRDYLSGVKIPGTEALVAIAEVGGVLVDWLATGRLPKTRAELKALQEAAKAATPGGVDSVLLQEVMEFFAQWQRDNATRVRIDKDRHATVIAILYKIAAKAGKVEKPELEQVLSLAA